MSRISIVTPTYRRASEVTALLDNLSLLQLLPYELILVDGAPPGEEETRHVVEARIDKLPFPLVYVRHSGGTAIQRNAGIDRVRGDFVAFIDDDIRLEPDFFVRMMEVYATDTERQVGGIAGYISNQYLNPATSPRWRWYRRLHLFKTYEPGRYDYETGYPINRYLQAPHDGVKEIDFMGSNCGVWRREVFDSGLRFDEFFRDYGMLEDAHLALRARKQWKLLECGRARCLHLHSPSGRQSKRKVSWKTAVNYRYVFMDIVRDRTFSQEFHFWKVQALEFVRLLAYAIKTRNADDWQGVLGKAEGILAAWRLKPNQLKTS